MLLLRSTNYKDFKVSFNGGLESKSSVKSFKWLSNPDMSEYESKSVKETVEDIKSSFNTDIQEKVDAYNNAVTTTKNNVNQAREDIKTTVDDFRNLFNSIKQPQKTTQTETSTVE